MATYSVKFDVVFEVEANSEAEAESFANDELNKWIHGQGDGPIDIDCDSIQKMEK